MRKLILIAALIGFGTSLSACNTMEGLGKDIQKGGQNLEESAEKNK